ncbi:MAG: response regulator transcription factor [Campylobacterota bacterium]|nr:response regulator transcription factor [Campylobacterota bacterium]
MKILLLEDDPFILEQVKNYFELDDHSVDCYEDGQSLLDDAVLELYDIFLLDINTPIKNGLDTLKAIRGLDIQTPAIFLTAMSDIDHVKKGYEVGCNDYVRKPFILDELSLRIVQLLHKTPTVTIGENYTFDMQTLDLKYHNNSVQLNQQEKDLLYLLLKHQGSTVNPELIMDYVWEDKAVCGNTLRTQIKKIRAKLKENFIENIRNSGYLIK